jgi:broad specificity phosphatase PhoE
MTLLFGVRHGETEWSRDGRHTSITDLPLTARGEEQARRLYGHLDPAAFGLVLCSPRHRSRVTAELAGFTGRYEPEIDQNLAEWFYGDYEGLTRKQVQQNDPGWTVWTRTPKNGETAEQVRTRLQHVIDRVLSAGVERAICFSHGHALRALTLVWLGIDLSRGDQFPLDTGTVSVLGDSGGERSLERWNAPVG